MALAKRMMVNILEHKQIEFVGRSAEQVRKWKYTFITSDNEIVHGYLDEERAEWANSEIDTNVFVESKAVETRWTGREWEGQITWKLV